MYEVVQVMVMIILAGIAVWDILYREFPVWVMMIIMFLVIACKVVLGDGDIINVIAGAAVGGGFLLISKLTEEALGYADSILILTLGIFLGVWQLFLLLVMAFAMAAIFSSAGMVMKKFSKDVAIPFIPFLAMSYAGVMLLHV